MTQTPTHSAIPAIEDAGLIAQPQERLLSLDALRGFDMFWIVGGEEVVHELSHSTHWHWAGVASWQLDHVPWVGFHAYDMIFPLFVFMVGVSLVFSLSKLIATRGRAVAIRRVIVRSAILYLIGIVYYGGFSKHFEDIRLLGVLQRIALCYLGAGLLFCFFRARGLALAAGILLVGYWALMSFVPVPGVSPHSFAEGKNLANWIDAHYLPFFKWDGDHDPEGLLSTLPAIAGCVLGSLAGLLLKDSPFRPYLRVLVLLAFGAAAIAGGIVWGWQFPIIKKIWTSSFVLLTAGVSASLLAMFYLVIDVWKIRRWTLPFVWIGTNAIALYALEHFLHFRDLAARLVGGELGMRVFRNFDGLVETVVALAIMFSIARFLYNRKVFIRV